MSGGKRREGGRDSDKGGSLIDIDIVCGDREREKDDGQSSNACSLAARVGSIDNLTLDSVFKHLTEKSFDKL